MQNQEPTTHVVVVVTDATEQDGMEVHAFASYEEAVAGANKLAKENGCGAEEPLPYPTEEQTYGFYSPYQDDMSLAVFPVEAKS